MEMNEESILAWNIIEKTNANLFLTGKAGTGKTTFLKRLKELSPKRMIVLAPTGIAAINAGGMTIHSFFQLPFSPYVPGTTFGSGEQKRYQFSKLKRNIIRSIDLLVIDEISMVRSDLLDAVDSVLRQYRKRHDLPFWWCAAPDDRRFAAAGDPWLRHRKSICWGSIMILLSSSAAML